MVELVRRVLRKLIGYNAWPYRMASRLCDLFSIVRSEGVSTLLLLRKLERGKIDTQQQIKFSKVEYPILIRPGINDVRTAIDNLVREEYGQHLPTKESPQWMIDAGAYIGDTSAYFLSKYPSLISIALEPAEESYKVAKLNLEMYGNRSILLKKGLYSSDNTLNFSGDTTGASISDSGTEIECVSISSLMQDYAIKKVDILKMDIEGAEGAIFEKNPEHWLNQVDVILIEIHGAKLESLILPILKENHYQVRQYRSVWYCRRLSQKTSV